MPITKQCYNDTAVKLIPINFFMLKIKMVKLHQLSRSMSNQSWIYVLGLAYGNIIFYLQDLWEELSIVLNSKQFPCIQSKIIQTGLFLT
jgi:hypothetical protein